MALIKLNNQGVKNATAFGSITGLGSMTFIKKLTASGSSTLSFVDGASGVVLDDTYKEYVFTFNNMHPATNGTQFSFQGNASGASGYNETITSTYFNAFHLESGSEGGLRYDPSNSDQANGTAFQKIIESTKNDNDSSMSGYLRLFNPSSTTFVKHFIAEANCMQTDPQSSYSATAGYFNTTNAIDEIQFKMASGNIDAGDICLYGIA
jgi:hypothetical protein